MNASKPSNNSIHQIRGGESERSGGLGGNNSCKDKIFFMEFIIRDRHRCGVNSFVAFA